MNRFVIVIAGIALLLGACDRRPETSGPTGVEATAAQVPAAQKIGPGVLEALARGESPAVLLSLDGGSPRGLENARRAAAAAQAQVLSRVQAGELRVRRRFATVPALAATVHSEAGLRRLAADPRVRRIDLEVGGSGGLVNSVPLIRGDLRHARGNEGAGVVVAILDTGFDSDHPDLLSALVGEACFGRDNSNTDGVGFCPDGTDRQTGAGAAEDDQGHGTHVAGIVTSDGTVSGPGVAPAASIFAIKVLDFGGNAGRFFFLSEIIAALDYIADNPQFGIQVANMSFGTNTQYSGECDDVDANTMAVRDVADVLRAAGVILFSSAGNSGGSQMGLPACVSTVVSVGASTATDTRANFSDVNETTDIFAPGVNIVSLQMGGGPRTASGTSMASPHAAGCAALLIQAGDATTPDQIEARLKTSAFTVTVGSNTFPRIDCAPDQNAEPVVAANSALVTVDEGSVATNSGTYVDGDGDAVTLSASVGTVVDNGDGTWSWSMATVDGPADSEPAVTITATDVLDAAGSTSFAVSVLNVVPDVEAGADATVTSNDVFEFSGTFSDPGVIDYPWSWSIDWDDGTQTSGSTSDQSAAIEASRQFCAAGDYTITLSVRDKDNGLGSDALTLTVDYLAVQIDITPTQSPNSLNPGNRGRLPVAVLGSATFDATRVDPATVVLGNESGTDTPVAMRPNGQYFASVEDANDDGIPDLVLHFEIQALVQNGDVDLNTTELVLRGFLLNGCTNFRGVDSVRVVP